VRWFSRQRETPEEARQRRLCRLMLGLPPETIYHHVREGVATIAGLCVILTVAIAWRLAYLDIVAPILVSGALLAVLTPTVLTIRRRYRHVIAGVLVLVLLLALLAATVHRYGNPMTFALDVGPTPSAIADAVSPR
jgi:hypothetical protein